MAIEQRLMAAILIQTVKDWDKPGYREEIYEFLDSQWFHELSSALELDQTNVRDKLISGQVAGQNIRAAYRKNTAAYMEDR